MDYREFTVVLPTLNEEKTIGVLIRRLLREYKGISVFVADDGSKDRTRGVVTAISKRNGKVRFVDRSRAGLEKGLSASAIDGILGSKTRFAIVMDADLQHPPEVVGRLARKLSQGCKISVAVRAEVEGWELHRKLISKALITVGYAMLMATGKSRCSDIFSGFFGVERELFEQTYRKNRRRFVGGGYKILYDLLKCIANGRVAVGEVPYSFGVREYGKSKAGLRQGLYLFKSFLT